VRDEIDTYRLIVRQHADGRRIVYGVLSAAIAAWGQPAQGEDWRGGELVDADRQHMTARIVREVGTEAHMPDSIIRACIADLPAEWMH
jgi:hypothetical protein